MCFPPEESIKILRGVVNVSNGEGSAAAVTANYYKTPRQGNYIKDVQEN